MRTTLIRTAVLIAALTATTAGVKATSSAPSQADDEKAIRLEGNAFLKASNAHDAKALAALFIPGGELVNEAGHVAQGRKTIERTFAAIFQSHPDMQISASIASIRFRSPSVAIEDGSSTITRKPGTPSEHNRYTVVHVKQDGKWQMASARDLPDEETSAGDELGQLEWLIGQWVDESPSALVTTSYRWDGERRAILSEFKLHVGGRPAMTGSQRISWDPVAKKIHSWVFDSEGGLAEGVWTRNGDQWIVKMTGTRRDGSVASATNVITQVSKDRLTWQSHDRVVGDDLLPNIEEIVIVRKAPQPAAEASSAGRDSAGDSK
jgi:uncharacterized protein (TIGR02246 family)